MLFCKIGTDYQINRKRVLKKGMQIIYGNNFLKMYFEKNRKNKTRRNI
jgi:hypothetical protein